jgi:hypothetical protein
LAPPRHPGHRGTTGVPHTRHRGKIGEKNVQNMAIKELYLIQGSLNLIWSGILNCNHGYGRILDGLGVFYVLLGLSF